jgi:hypothetical protein
VPGGRPTQDPKETLVAVRLAERQLRVLEARAHREGVGLSEAVRRCLDEWAASRSPTSRRRALTREERETFNQVFAAVGLKPNPHGRRRRRS